MELLAMLSETVMIIITLIHSGLQQMQQLDNQIV